MMESIKDCLTIVLPSKPMTVTEQYVNDFSAFAKSRLATGVVLSIDQLYDEWRETHSTEEDTLALKAALNDMKRGEQGRDFDEFAGEFRQRNGLSGGQ